MVHFQILKTIDHRLVIFGNCLVPTKLQDVMNPSKLSECYEFALVAGVIASKIVSRKGSLPSGSKTDFPNREQSFL